MRWVKSLFINAVADDLSAGDLDACIYDTDGENSKGSPSVESPHMLCMPCIINGIDYEQAIVANQDSHDDWVQSANTAHARIVT